MNIDGLSDDAVSMILSNVRSIAVIGASANPDRPSYRVMSVLIERGYTVHPVNPGLAGTALLGRMVFARLSDVPAPVDLVDVFRASDAVPEIVAAVLENRERLSIGCLWLQLGVINVPAAAAAAAAGVVVVMDRCTKIEIERFGLAAPPIRP